jgi:surfeit locus 1 family protein
MNLRRSFTFLTILTFGALCVLVALGTWQVNRLSWKQTLIEEANERPTLAPLTDADFPNVETMDVDAFHYRRAILSGTYLPEHQVQVFTSLSDAKGHYEGPGYWIVTPFRWQQARGETYIVLVNRGFVPESLWKQGNLDLTPPEGQQTIEGLIRIDDEVSYFTPQPSPEQDLYFRRNINQIFEGEAIEGNPAPFTLDLAAQPNSALPQAGETRQDFSNRHMQYAVTWYGLALVLICIYLTMLWNRKKQKSE